MDITTVNDRHLYHPGLRHRGRAPLLSAARGRLALHLMRESALVLSNLDRAHRHPGAVLAPSWVAVVASAGASADWSPPLLSP
jgi:hypothetical protein